MHLSPSVTALARSSGRNNVKASSIASGEIVSGSEAIRSVLVGKIASKARAYGWNACEQGSVSEFTVGVCLKSLQSAADCLICWQIMTSRPRQHEPDAMRPAFCLKSRPRRSYNGR